MDSNRVENTVLDIEGIIDRYGVKLDIYTQGIRPEIRSIGKELQDEVTLNVTSSEVYIIRVTGVLTANAEYHLTRAYFRTSPGIIAIILGIIDIIGEVIRWISIVNDIIVALTGENIAHWLNYLIPGFEEAWERMMIRISNLSSALGWGVDGVGHLLNAVNLGGETWCMIRGKPKDTFKLEKVNRLQSLLGDMGSKLDEWENVPGKFIDWIVEHTNRGAYWEGSKMFRDWGNKITQWSDQTIQIFSNISSIASELSALQDNMPDLIARNIPQVVWDSLERVQNVIDDSILPVVNDIMDRVDEVNQVLDDYRERAEAIAESLNRPGDILERINNLSEQLKQEQLEKVESAANSLFEKANTDEYNEKAVEFANLGSIIEVLQSAPRPLPFMQYELPGRSPGIVAEYQETWFVGDY